MSVPPAFAGSPYRLHELGWLGLERLADAVLALDADAACDWSGRADRARAGLVDSDLSLGSLGRLAGPVLVLADAGVMRDASEWAQVVAGLREQARSVLVLSLDPGAPAWAEALAPAADLPHVVLGHEALGALLDAEPAVRERVPAVLALCSGTIASASSFDLDAARALARVFVSTGPYLGTLATLHRTGLAVVTGPPEMGKTAIAQMVALTRATMGWDVHACSGPDELLSRLDHARPQVFVADDAFGSAGGDAGRAQRWSQELEPVLAAVDATHWLIWTSRPAPLKTALDRIAREHGGVALPVAGQVRADPAALDLEDRAAILLRHASTRDLGRRFRERVRTYGADLVRDECFTPERARRFVREPRIEHDAGPILRPELADAATRAIRTPTADMRAAWDAMTPEQRDLLIAGLDTPAGAVPERILAAAVRRHAQLDVRRRAGEVAATLAGHVLRVDASHDIAWEHPSWRDLALEALAADGAGRAAFVEHAGRDGLLAAIERGAGRPHPLLVEHLDWERAARRVRALGPSLDEPLLARLLDALRDAHEDAGGHPGVRELALAGLQVADPWLDERPFAVSLDLLERCHVLAAELAPGTDVPPPPRIAATWVELLPPASISAEHPAQERERALDWMRLVSLLMRYDAPALAAYGPEEEIFALTARVSEAATPDWLSPGPDALTPAEAARRDPGGELVARVLADLEAVRPAR